MGILPYYVYLGVRKAVTSENKKIWSTVLNVLIGVFLLVGCRAFINKVFDANPRSTGAVWAGAVLGFIGGVISFNGVIEAIVAAIIVAALGVALNKIKPIQK